jgi:hypothetical protein
MVTMMRAIELFTAMQTGKLIEVMDADLYTWSLRITGMVAEDGSGACWIVFAHDFHNHEQVKFFVRTVDNGMKFVFRYIPKANVYRF